MLDTPLTVRDVWFKWHHDKAESLEFELRMELNPAERVKLQSELDLHRVAMRRLIREARR